MKRFLLLAVCISAIVGSASAVDLSSVPCPPGNVPDIRSDEYTLDDGTGDNSIGLTAGGTLFWYNGFQIMSGYENITSVGVAWGQIAAGRAAEIQIFADPNNDGDATDVTMSDLLWSTPATSEGGDTDTFFQYPVPSINVGSAGGFFFVGVCCNQNAGEYPARVDQSSSFGQSWVGGSGNQGADCDNPNSGSLGLLAIIDTYGLPGNWMVRASADGNTPVQTATWGSVKSMYR